MKDVYVEQLVKQKADSKTFFYKGLCVFVVAVAALAGFFIHALFLLLALVLGVGAYYLLQNLDIEYEYLYVNGELDFDKIYGKARRKRILTVEMEHLETMAIKGSHGLDSLRTMPHKTFDFTSRDENGRVYEMYIRTEGELLQIFYEPNDEIVEAVRMLSPRKVVSY